MGQAGEPGSQGTGPIQPHHSLTACPRASHPISLSPIFLIWKIELIKPLVSSDYMWMVGLTQPGPWKPSVNSKGPGELSSISLAKTWQRRRPVESGLAMWPAASLLFGTQDHGGCLPPSPRPEPQEWGGVWLGRISVCSRRGDTALPTILSSLPSP